MGNYYARNNYYGSHLYTATFEKFHCGNKMFRSKNDWYATKRAEKISAENDYGKIYRIYEINPQTYRIIRVIGRIAQ